MREACATAFAVELSDAVERTDHVVSEDPTSSSACTGRRAATGLLPCVYSIHGGGYIIGIYEMDDASSTAVREHPVRRRVGRVPARARDRRTPVRSRTATPGCSGPTSTPTSSASTATRIGIAGVSAGGGLAAALALLARDRGEIPLAFQLLECPMIDDRQITSSSQLDGLPIWSREANDLRLAELPRRALRHATTSRTTRRRPARRTSPGSRPRW